MLALGLAQDHDGAVLCQVDVMRVGWYVAFRVSKEVLWLFRRLCTLRHE